MRKDLIRALVRSWAAEDSTVTPNREILDWIQEKNRTTAVDIHKIGLRDMGDWYYSREEGVLRNRKGSFFRIAGIRRPAGGGRTLEQPMILQPENGYLGMICREIDGIPHFLMQAKIEPGNLNRIQLSPTIQATKSNFTQAHGGRRPHYLEYFTNAARYEIILDQLQSEQSSRFLKKRNRNMILWVGAEEPVEQLPSHRWMTLGQIVKLMNEHDNLVNMDTRTVLSGIPFFLGAGTDSEELAGLFPDKSFFRSVFGEEASHDAPLVYHALNDYKMFSSAEYETVPLDQLRGWRMTEEGIFPESGGGFQVIYCRIEIEGREVRRWTQPLLEATAISTFGLVCTEVDGVLRFLVRTLPEVGCFDGIELGPSVQRDAAAAGTPQDPFDRLLAAPEAETLCSVLLSEEGGRFYHEQNRNIIVRVPRELLPPLPEGTFLLDYQTLNRLCQTNNVLNIQLRNLLSLLRIST